jgi:hypothetical protein
MVVVIFALAVIPVLGQDQNRGLGRGRSPFQPEILLEVLSPTSPPDRDTVVFNSGWPLIIQLVATGNPDLSSFSTAEPFPPKDAWGFILWDDPDGCLSWDSNFCGDQPADETALQFRATDREQVDLGYLPDVPALVMLADTGEGWDDEGPILRGLNLAGLVSAVGYELNDVTRSTNVTIKLVVPFGLFAPHIEVDRCIGDPVTCDGTTLVRVRGFGDELLSFPPGGCNLYGSIFDNRPVNLRVFVLKLPPSRSPLDPVQGLPAIEDADGNGIVDIHDAVLLGFELLSDELVVEFKQISGDAPVFEEFVRAVDLDGNGEVEGPLLPCPDPTPSPVGARKPPR